MIASRRRTELNGILACFPDGATIRITYPAAYCRITRRGMSRRTLSALARVGPVGSNPLIGGARATQSAGGKLPMRIKK